MSERPSMKSTKKTPKTNEKYSRQTRSTEIFQTTVDADYEITVVTGEQSLDGAVTLHIRGDNGMVTIPLTKTTEGNQPFQSKSTDRFTCQTTDVQRIRRIQIETNPSDSNQIWNLKNVQIKKGNQTYEFVRNDFVLLVKFFVFLSLGSWPMFDWTIEQIKLLYFRRVIRSVKINKILFKLNFADCVKVFVLNHRKFDHERSKID